MSEEVVFDPDVVVSEQALERKNKFRENKRRGLFDTEPKSIKDQLPKLWFDDTGEIVAMTYDPNFQPDDTWKTWEFDEKSLKKIKVIGTNFYKVEREVFDEDVIYKIVLRKDQTRRVVHSSNLKHAKQNHDPEKVNIMVDVHEKFITLHLTDVGRYLMENLPEKYSNLGTQNFYITESLNPHFMLKHFTFDPAELLVADIKYELKGDYRLKSVYFDGPFVYGRL